jgi:pyrroline-5-carboxylate reductase
MTTEATHPTISFIGGGNMARALIGGLVEAGTPGDHITVADPSAAQRNAAESDFGIRSGRDNAAAVAGCNIIVLAVKPQIMDEVLASIQGTLARDALVVSVAAGITLARLAAGLGEHLALVRAMPNTPALYGAGITGMVANDQASQAQRQLAENVMGSAGQTVWIEDESLMDVVTALSGSGPAYFFALTEHLSQAGERAGLPAETARRLARQTAVGAGVMLAQSELEADELRRRVTSPGGTTEAALKSLNGSGFAAMVERAIEAAVQRGRELGADD